MKTRTISDDFDIEQAFIQGEEDYVAKVRNTLMSMSEMRMSTFSLDVDDLISADSIDNLENLLGGF
jgi:hypothetical protein